VVSAEAEWRILAGAFDELSLWELPGHHTYLHSGGTALTSDLSLEEARVALVSAVRRGFVELYEQFTDGLPKVPTHEALALVTADEEWSVDSASRRVALTITEAGELRSHEAFARLREESPFRAAGAVDPHEVTREDA
jgi:hypothetical protein